MIVHAESNVGSARVAGGSGALGGVLTGAGSGRVAGVDAGRQADSETAVQISVRSAREG
jgi:hypothetical protein